MIKGSVLLFVCIVVLVVSRVDGQSRKCILQDDCEKCLLIDPACAWCTDRNYNLKKPRCMTEEELLAAGCESVYQNKYVGLEIIENKALMDYSVTSSGSFRGSAANSTSSGSFSSRTETSGSSSGGASRTGATEGGSDPEVVQVEANVIQIQPQRLKLSIAKGKY